MKYLMILAVALVMSVTAAPADAGCCGSAQCTMGTMGSMAADTGTVAADRIKGNVYLDSANVVATTRRPTRVSLGVAGSLPTPSHRLDWTVQRDRSNIRVSLFSLVDPNKISIQVLKPFAQSIDLGVFSPGRYTVWVNGKKAGTFRGY